ncbi:PQQ-dependent sugar dehydrogenase [Pedobacter arcticus]|uniref:PQQ-dependent sugar dehydrogenase n=1 Tax=Pedobacter arcticus TaxID=752140 RepID=UPI0002F712B4|nr:PQQ-dependent sugar dehydrogenase [Pedobacter arcticus]
MKTKKSLTLLGAITIISFLSLGLQEKDRNTLASPEANYQSYCSGCHGAKMNAFADRKWKNGKNPEDLFKSIKFGYKEGGMPAFAETFKDDEIKALADYIIKGIENVSKYSFTDKPKSTIFETENGKIKLQKVFNESKNPWGIVFLPNSQMLVTDRSGVLYLVGADGKNTKVNGVPKVVFAGQGGLMDVLVHPDFAKNKIVYLSYSKPNPDDATQQTTAIFKAELKYKELINGKDIFIAKPYSKTKHHYGSRMIFGKDKMLYFSVGERGNEKENPQDIRNGLGKIHRITENGDIPKDNPFYNTPEADKTIYSYGQRNPQGLALNPFTNEIWEHEHGPRGGDEINIIKKGANYGWPMVSYGINYNGKVITPLTQKEGIEGPLHYWNPSIAPSGMAFVTSKIYKGWEGNLMVGSLRFQYLNRCVIKDGKVVKEELLFKNIGRVRDVRQAPNGYLYMAVEGEGIFKLVPQQ